MVPRHTTFYRRGLFLFLEKKLDRRDIQVPSVQLLFKEQEAGQKGLVCPQFIVWQKLWSGRSELQQNGWVLTQLSAPTMGASTLV